MLIKELAVDTCIKLQVLGLISGIGVSQCREACERASRTSLLELEVTVTGDRTLFTRPIVFSYPGESLSYVSAALS